jgi:polysaccharide transporter, PST family
LSAYFDDSKPQEDHAKKSVRGGAMSVAARGINAIVQIGSVLFLARLLSPEDYGLVSMVTALTGFAPALVDLGTRDAIVQRTSITKGEVSALFWFTIIVGCVFAVLAAASGPLISRFYGEPRLTMIVLVSSTTFIAYALSVQHYALMRRALMFQELAVLEIVSNVASAVAAITVALMGYHYWALVVRPIFTPLFLAVGVWFKCRWMPGKPEITTGVKETMRFGLNVTGFCMTDFAARSGDRVAIGYRSGPVGLGLYQNALFVYDNLIDVLVFPLHGVAVASLSKLRHDLAELRRQWGKALSAVAFYAMPAFGLLAVTSQDLISMLLGKKWESAGILLSVLALRGIPQCVERTLGWLHVTAGRTDRWMRWGVLTTCLQFVAVFAGLPFGPMGVAVAYVICAFILFVPALAYAGRPLEIGASDVIQTVWRQMAAALAAAAVGFGLRWTIMADSSPLVRIAVLAIAYLAAYLILSVGVLNVRAPLRTTQLLVRGFLPARVAHLLG